MPDAQKFETNAKEDTWMEIYIQAVCHMVFVVSSVSSFFLTQLLTSRRNNRKKKKEIFVVCPAQK